MKKLLLTLSLVVAGSAFALRELNKMPLTVKATDDSPYATGLVYNDNGNLRPLSGYCNKACGSYSQVWGDSYDTSDRSAGKVGNGPAHWYTCFCNDKK